jgi:hypothetical protein
LRYLEEGREGERKKVKKRIRVEESREERKEGWEMWCSGREERVGKRGTGEMEEGERMEGDFIGRRAEKIEKKECETGRRRNRIEREVAVYIIKKGREKSNYNLILLFTIFGFTGLTVQAGCVRIRSFSRSPAYRPAISSLPFCRYTWWFKTKVRWKYHRWKKGNFSFIFQFFNVLTIWWWKFLPKKNILHLSISKCCGNNNIGGVKKG